MENQDNGRIQDPLAKEIALKERVAKYNRKYFEKMQETKGKEDKPK